MTVKDCFTGGMTVACSLLQSHPPNFAQMSKSHSTAYNLKRSPVFTQKSRNRQPRPLIHNAKVFRTPIPAYNSKRAPCVVLGVSARLGSAHQIGPCIKGPRVQGFIARTFSGRFDKENPTAKSSKMLQRDEMSQ